MKLIIEAGDKLFMVISEGEEFTKSFKILGHHEVLINRIDEDRIGNIFLVVKTIKYELDQAQPAP